MMEEDEYKSIYNNLASVRCAFEKAMTNNQTKCHLARHFYLADREGYSCADSNSSAMCFDFLEKVRKKSVFVFKVKAVDGPLAHNKEIRVQVGGLTGLAKLIDLSAQRPAVVTVVDDVIIALKHVVEKYGSLVQLPYGEIVQSVAKYQGRRRRKN